MGARLKPLAERYVEILAVGGPRKPAILRALAPDQRAFDRAIRSLKRARRIVVLYRHGGPHYALAEVRS